MDLLIGNKIKSLRKQRSITQEQLAESIGISFQAVSKWENNIALPDISLVSALANYFGVTTDELFDFNLKEMQKKITAIRDEAYKYRESDPPKNRGILENGLKAVEMQKWISFEILLKMMWKMANSRNYVDFFEKQSAT